MLMPMVHAVSAISAAAHADLVTDAVRATIKCFSCGKAMLSSVNSAILLIRAVTFASLEPSAKIVHQDTIWNLIILAPVATISLLIASFAIRETSLFALVAKIHISS